MYVNLNVNVYGFNRYRDRDRNRDRKKHTFPPAGGMRGEEKQDPSPFTLSREE